jgi:hypothetical protein
VNFYNGNRESGAQITAETADGGHFGALGARLGPVFLTRPVLLSLDDSQAGQLPLEIFTTAGATAAGPRPTAPPA